LRDRKKTRIIRTKRNHKMRKAEKESWIGISARTNLQTTILNKLRNNKKKSKVLDRSLATK